VARIRPEPGHLDGLAGPGRFLGRFQEVQLPWGAAPPLVEDFGMAPATAFVDAQVVVALAVLRQ
jgi:hypothetical protein